MISKVAGLARALAIILAVVAAFITIPNLNVALVLVILGLIAGLAYSEDNVTRLILTVLVLPAVAVALATIPAIGSYLGAVATNVALAATGASATLIAIRLFNLVKGDLTGLVSK
jgi:hypothetical protein